MHHLIRVCHLALHMVYCWPNFRGTIQLLEGGEK
jgi:hypothetical protein